MINSISKTGFYNQKLLSLVAVWVTTTAFLAYFFTLAPTITWRNGGSDSGELAAAVATLGIPHPPGYPTYMLMGRAWVSLPLGGDVAYRLNLLSAVGAALAAGLLAVTIGRLGRQLAPGRLPMVTGSAVGGLLLALSPLTWSQATITEVYAPGLAALSLVTLLIFTPTRRVQPERGLLAGVVAGLGLGVMPQLVLALPGAIGLLYFQHRPVVSSHQRVLHKIVPFVTGVVLGLLTFLYLPLRAGAQPAFNWGNPGSLARFWWVVSTAQYHHLAGVGDLSTGIDRLVTAGLFSAQQLGVAAIALAALGGFTLWPAHKPVLGYLLSLIGLTLLFQMSYPVLNNRVYLLPVLFGLALLVGLGVWRLLVVIRLYLGQKGAIILSLVLLTILGWRGLATAPQVDASTDLTAVRFGEQALARVSPQALLVSDDDKTTFSLWYWQALGHRTDVVVVDSRLLHYQWYRDHLTQQYPDLNPAAVRHGGLTALARPVYVLAGPPEAAQVRPVATLSSVK